MKDTRPEVLTADYWDLWDRFAQVINTIYTYEQLDEVRAVARSHGFHKLHRDGTDDDVRFVAIWRQALTPRDEATLDAVATHLTDPDRPEDD